MATVQKVKGSERAAALEAASKAGARTLESGLAVPEGQYRFVTADKGTFGILEVQTATDKWALPIVAGTMTVNGSDINFVISDKPGDKTLVVANDFYLQMQPATAYTITIGKSSKGRKIVSDVVPAGAIAEPDEE